MNKENQQKKPSRTEYRREWRKRNPDKLDMEHIRRAIRICEKHPEYGYQVIQTGKKGGDD